MYPPDAPFGAADGMAYCTANGDLLAFHFDGTFAFDVDTFLIVSELPAVGVFGTGGFAHVRLGDAPGIATDHTDPVARTSFGHVSDPIVYDASDRARR